MDEKVAIMVVDDQEGPRESLKMILEIKNYEVSTFSDGASAIKTVVPGKYHIAFIDMKLTDAGEEGPMKSDTGGIVLLKEIKKIDPSVEVAIVTGYAHAFPDTKAEAITYGAMEYLNKPFLVEEIYELVERGLLRRRERFSKKHESPKTPPPTSIH